MSLRLSPKETTAVKLPLVVGAPAVEPEPATSGSPPPHAASNSAEKSQGLRDRNALMRNLDGAVETNGRSLSRGTIGRGPPSALRLNPGWCIAARIGGSSPREHDLYWKCESICSSAIVNGACI